MIGAPLFKKATIQLENGNTIEINAEDNSADNRYINKLKVNGKTYSQNYLDHNELMKGATLEFKMSDQPNMNRGIDDKDFPYSFSKKVVK